MTSVLSSVRVMAIVGVVLLSACGKKGPPLAPIVRIPAAIETITPLRVGNDVFLTLTVPRLNIDGTQPIDILEVRIYAYTGRTPPPRNRFAEAGTLVATVPVAPPPPPPGAPPETAAEPAPPARGGAAIGSVITVRDTLTPDEFEPGPVLTTPVPAGARPLPVVAAPPAPAGPLRRYYLAVGISTRGDAGPQPAPAELPLFQLPQPPDEVLLQANATSTIVSWDRPFGILGFLFDAPLPPEASPAEDPFAPPRPAASAVAAPAPSGPMLFNVYLTREPVAPAAPAASESTPPAAPAAPGSPPPATPWTQAPEVPLNPVPLAVTQFADIVDFGRERCYTVRSLRGTPPQVLISEPSPEACITAVDTFPPAAPAGLAAVAAQGLISLIWEPSGEVDLAGYVVLRGAVGDATLQPLTAMPVNEARFVDQAVTAGQRYVYAVVAVDTADNRSAESTRVEETAR